MDDPNLTRKYAEQNFPLTILIESQNAMLIAPEHFVLMCHRSISQTMEQTMTRIPSIFLFCCLAGCMTCTAAEGPNVVLILADDLGYGDLSCFGQNAYSTPAIDRLAAEGVKATDYYVPVPYCAPSRASLLTGRFPLRHGMTRNPHPDKTPEADVVGIDHRELTLGEAFQQAGYRTGMVGKWHLGHKQHFYPTRHGFDSYYGILYSNDMLPVQILQDEIVVENPVDQRTLTTKYTQKAIEFINGSGQQPFFLYFAHAMPHKPLAVSDKYYTPNTPNDLYADVIRELDWSVAQVREALETRGILDNTIFIFTSDNGPHYGGSTGGLKGKKSTPWEGGTRVPFIVRYPAAFPRNTTIDLPIWSLDLFPTLLQVCGVELPRDRVIDGQNILTVLQGNSKVHGPIFTCHDETIVTIRNGDWKLYLTKPKYLSSRDLNPNYVDPTAPNGKTIIAQIEQPTSMQYPGVVPKRFQNRTPLFNLANDRTEAVDVAKDHPEVVSAMRKKYMAFVASLEESE